ncbi:MAG: helix-turn-helix transcriptional regulator [Bacilli bacterium]|nr:helix-turn-helix transcriptional regulator [Bacilli bacterium]
MRKIENYINQEKQISEMEYELITEFIKLRKDANLSQQDIANQSKVIRTTVARIENGMNSPQIKTMLQILEPLGYTLKIEKIKK